MTEKTHNYVKSVIATDANNELTENVKVDNSIIFVEYVMKCKITYTASLPVQLMHKNHSFLIKFLLVIFFKL